MQQAERAQARAKDFEAKGSADAAAEARAAYRRDVVSLRRLKECKEACVTNLPKSKERRQYHIQSNFDHIEDDELEVYIDSVEGLAKQVSTYAVVKLGWPDKDAPQTAKTQLAGKDGLYASNVMFAVNREEGRKGFASKLAERRPGAGSNVKIEFELFEKTWNPFSDPVIGACEWNQMPGLLSHSEVVGEVQIRPEGACLHQWHTCCASHSNRSMLLSHLVCLWTARKASEGNRRVAPGRQLRC